mmetsp:Transcript_48558/g.140698  ORF Transcript_48558/g.140698 Transcript_48558/m.140698 type:complete len:200 (-) Transcript_48558:213-812(-)
MRPHQAVTLFLACMVVHQSTAGFDRLHEIDNSFSRCGAESLVGTHFQDDNNETMVYFKYHWGLNPGFDIEMEFKEGFKPVMAVKEFEGVREGADVVEISTLDCCCGMMKTYAAGVNVQFSGPPLITVAGRTTTFGSAVFRPVSQSTVHKRGHPLRDGWRRRSAGTFRVCIFAYHPSILRALSVTLPSVLGMRHGMDVKF